MRTNDVDTPALAALQDKDLGYEIIRTKPARSAEESAELQGIEIHQLLRTIVLRRAENDYLFVLVPGGRAIDWPKLRAHLGVSRLSLPDKDEATAATGYERGAITPFGSTTTWPVIADASIVGAELVAIGGGAHGVNLHVAADELISFVNAEVADVTKGIAT
jgi:Cys-tRNA(Pro)/Cys-tRNA(Cys) deacylase